MASLLVIIEASLFMNVHVSKEYCWVLETFYLLYVGNPFIAYLPAKENDRNLVVYIFKNIDFFFL